MENIDRLSIKNCLACLRLNNFLEFKYLDAIKEKHEKRT